MGKVNALGFDGVDDYTNKVVDGWGKKKLRHDPLFYKKSQYPKKIKGVLRDKAW